MQVQLLLFRLHPTVSHTPKRRTLAVTVTHSSVKSGSFPVVISSKAAQFSSTKAITPSHDNARFAVTQPPPHEKSGPVLRGHGTLASGSNPGQTNPSRIRPDELR